MCVCVFVCHSVRACMRVHVVISCLLGYVFLTNRSSRPTWAVGYIREGALSYSPLDKIELVATVTRRPPITVTGHREFSQLSRLPLCVCVRVCLCVCAGVIQLPGKHVGLR